MSENEASEKVRRRRIRYLAGMLGSPFAKAVEIDRETVKLKVDGDREKGDL